MDPENKSFFQSAEWQAFIKPFKQFLAIFTKSETTAVSPGQPVDEQEKLTVVKPKPAVEQAAPQKKSPR